MTTEHKDLDDLKARFEDGDRPTGDDFARLIDSCHNTRHLTNTTITGTLSVQGGLTVDGSINTRDVAADGAKLDSLDSFVRSNSDSWEESEHILAVSSTVETVSSVLSSNINSLNSTLSTYIDNNVNTLQDSITTLDTKVDTNNANVNSLINTNHLDINLRVDGVAVTLEETSDTLDDVRTVVKSNSGQWAEQTDVAEIAVELNSVSTTVNTNSSNWNENTNALADLTDVDFTTLANNDVLKYDEALGKWYPAPDIHGSAHHADEFLGLHDTPVDYTGMRKFVKINDLNNGLTFIEHDSDSWDQVVTTVSENSGQWSEQTDISNITTTVKENSGQWSEQTDITDITTTVKENSASWADHTDIINITTTVKENSASWADHTDVTELTTGLTDVTTTVSENSASWADHTDVTELTTSLTDVTTTVSENSANWADHTDVTELTTGLTDVTTTVSENSGTWVEAHSHVKQVSGSWAKLDSNGILFEDQIPELSITQTYTVQNAEEVQTLNPAEGIQRGDIVIVTSTYDNLIAKQDNPTGAYNQTTKAYSGYSKLAIPESFVTSVNDMYGNVTVTSDDITDDGTNKWVTQSDIDRWNSSNTFYVNTSGDTLTGDLDTQAKYLSGGVPLHDIFSINTVINGDQTVNGNQTVTGDSQITGNVTASKVSSNIYETEGQTGITKNVNVGGNILHIVNGLIVGVTDAE